MSLLSNEPLLAAAFQRDALRLLEEARAVWAAFAETKRLRFTPRDTEGMPRIDGRIEGTDVALAAVGDERTGFRTRATASANTSLSGKVVVRPPGTWDDLIGQVRKRRFFGDAYLDERLVVKASPAALARTVLDPRVVETVSVLAPRRVRELSYASGAIAIEWGGVERDAAVLDDVLDVLGYLAVRGSKLPPYR